MNPTLKETFNSVNAQIKAQPIEEVTIVTPGVVPVKAKFQLRFLRSYLRIWYRLAKRNILSAIRFIRKEIKRNQDEGVMPPPKILPGPAIEEVKFKGFGSPPRGCSLYEFDVKTGEVRLAEIKRIWNGQYDKDGKKVFRSSVFQKPDHVYFWSLNMKNAKKKCGIR